MLRRQVHRDVPSAREFRGRRCRALAQVVECILVVQPLLAFASRVTAMVKVVYKGEP
jgi:hypothetical protein